MVHAASRRARAALLCVIATTLVGACDSTHTTAPVATPPQADSPIHALRRTEWAFDHSDVGMVAGLLTDDFELSTASPDSAGALADSTAMSRAGVLRALHTLFDGVPGVSGPATVEVTLDENLAPYPDPRPGKSPVVHRTIGSAVRVVVHRPPSPAQERTGYAVVFLTRGDSAFIPPELVAQGAASDSMRWWISGLEDVTLAPVSADPAFTRPAGPMSLARPLRGHLTRASR